MPVNYQFDHLPLAFPTMPPEVTAIRCDRCSVVWKDGEFRVKFISRACSIHVRYLVTP
jgi:hypothetical protein